MEYLYFVLLIFELIWSLEVKGKYVLLRITDEPSYFPNDGVKSTKGNNKTSSRTIKHHRKPSQRSAVNPCKKLEYLMYLFKFLYNDPSLKFKQ